MQKKYEKLENEEKELKQYDYTSKDIWLQIW